MELKKIRRFFDNAFCGDEVWFALYLVFVTGLNFSLYLRLRPFQLNINGKDIIPPMMALSFVGLLGLTLLFVGRLVEHLGLNNLDDENPLS